MVTTKIKRYNPSEKDLVSDWHVIDAKGQVLGRLATQIATLLMGKHRPEYVRHMISGDFVVVINAADVVVTGNKAEQITYKRHIYQRAGHIKEIPYSKMQEKFPERVIEHAVRGMLPRNRLGERMIRMLKVYAGPEHPHAAQIIGSERRPERDAAAAAKAAEEADSKKRASARAEIAEEAKSKSTEAKAEETKAEAATATEEKPAEEKKPATRRRASSSSSSSAKSSTAAKPKSTRSTASKKKSDDDSDEKKTTARKSTTTRRASTRSKKTDE